VKTNPAVTVLAGLAALIIALATVGWKVRKAAAANPVDALRYE
jgi:ABC-type antimicrobial peptide transport system permease subunit